MKFARVNLEPESFGDPRFAHLARLLALPGGDGHFALIKVALIWSWQTEHYTPSEPCFHVPEDVIEMALGVDGAAGRAALVRARLAEETPDGLRMRGSSHDRTGWLWRIRAKSEAGGRAKAATAKRKAANESLPGADHGHAPGVPVQSPLSSLLFVPEDPDHTHRARAGDGQPVLEPVTDATAGSGDDVPGRPSEAAPARGADSILALISEAAEALSDERARIDPTALPIGDATAGAVVARLAETPPGLRRRSLWHAVTCAIARSRVTGTIDPLRWSTFGSPAAWTYVQGASVAEYAKSAGRPGHGARDSPRAAPDRPLRGAAAARALAERLEAEENSR